MNNLRNRVQLIGNLGGNPEVTKLDSGKKVAKLSIATHDIYRNNAGDKVIDTQWHQLVAWGKKAELAEKYLKKGHEVAIEGKLISRSYDDKQGIKRYITEVIVNEILLLTAKS
jgi:single-strand DNA-binding protein